MAQLPEKDGKEAFAAFSQAMKDGNTNALRSLTSESFTLIHLTGYLQPRDEWLVEIEEGKFIYYSIDTREIFVDEVGERVVARTLTDARVYGGRKIWKLQLALTYSRHQGHWIADLAVASVWT